MATVWNFKLCTGLWPLYISRWFFPGLAIGRTVPSIKPKQFSSGTPIWWMQSALGLQSGWFKYTVVTLDNFRVINIINKIQHAICCHAQDWCWSIPKLLHHVAVTAWVCQPLQTNSSGIPRASTSSGMSFSYSARYSSSSLSSKLNSVYFLYGKSKLVDLFMS